MSMDLQPSQLSSWESIREFFEDSIPFHKILNLKVEDLEIAQPKLKVSMQDSFVGNFVHGNLHGGVISSLLDVIGGIVVLVELVGRRGLHTTEELIDQFGKMGTIDIRVDYLRPGFGQHFIASAYVLRTGNRVSVSRMELHNDENTLIAVGTGAYVHR